MAGAQQQVRGNCLRDNGQYGMNAYRPGDGITDARRRGQRDRRQQHRQLGVQVAGCGCSGGVKFWAVNGADIRGNWVHDNHGAGLWADTNNNDFLIEDNLIEDNDGGGLFYEISYNIVVAQQHVPQQRDRQGQGVRRPGRQLPGGGDLHLARAGGEPRSSRARTDRSRSPATRSRTTGSASRCGRTRTASATARPTPPPGTARSWCRDRAACAQPGIATANHWSTDCRWRTQTRRRPDNTFRFDPAAVGCRTGCAGERSVLQLRDLPEHLALQGHVVQDAIAFAQGNRWSGNSYQGPWAFVGRDLGARLTAAQWQAAPFGQDACSSFTGGQPTC